MTESRRKPDRRIGRVEPTRQRGAALLIALLLLLILTLLGLTSSNVAIMQERMAGNMVQSNQAFQLAESTLRAVEARVFNDICLSGGSGGFGVIPRLPDLGLDPNDCTMSGLPDPSSGWPLAPAEVDQPGGDGWARFFIAQLPNRPRCHAMQSDLSGGGKINDESYVVMASGRAASGNSEAIVQAVYTCKQ